MKKTFSAVALTCVGLALSPPIGADDPLLTVGTTALQVHPGSLPADSNCLVNHETPGCDVPECEQAVCATDSFCCTNVWDSFCVDLAESECDAVGSVSVATDQNTFTLNVGGDAAKPGGGSWAALSDSRLKRDVEPIPPGMLQRLLSLQGYTFRYRDEAIRGGLGVEGQQIGLLAGEVADVFPAWVHEGADGYHYVTERSLTAIFVEALRELRQEQNAEIEKLEAETDDLRTEVERLTSALQDLRAGQEE